MKQNWFGIFIFLALFISCLDEEEIDRDYPKIVTNAVTEISLSGATLSGTIETSALGEIFEHGFIWGQDKNLLPENSFSLQFATPSTNTPSVKIKSSLVSQKIYYARFYIKTGNKTIYGGIVSFKSLGSEGPKITSLSPSSGVLGDTVVIRGRNFIDAADRNLVKFDVENVSILSVSDSTLKVIVPNNLSLEFEHVKVSVSIEGNVAYSPEPFTLLLSKIIPVITFISPQSIKACDTVLVVGKNFKSDSDFLKVFLQNNEEANLIKATDDSILFSIKLLPSNEFGFTIKSGRFDTHSEINFTELRPEFISISPLTHKPGAIMTLAVKNFPTCLPIIASTYGYEVDIISRTENEVKIKLSDYCGYPGDINIGFGIGYYDNFLTTSSIHPQPLKILSVEPNHGTVNQEVVIKGEGFFFIQENETYFLNITSYSENEIRGTVKEAYAPNGKVDVRVNSCNQFAVLEAGFEYDAPVILDFNPKIITSRDQIITIEGKNFSQGANTNSIFFSNSYSSTSGSSFDGNQLTFYADALIPDALVETKFSTLISVRTAGGMVATTAVDLVVDHDGPWKKLKDFPGEARDNGISFSIAGKGYVGLGEGRSAGQYSYITHLTDLWEFDPITEDWTQKSNFPGIHAYESNETAVVNDKAYHLIQTKELWEYDPAINSWSQKVNYPGGPAEDRMMMTINNKIYVGGGTVGGVAYDFWEYDPGSNTWTRKTDIPHLSQFAGAISNASIFFDENGKGIFYYDSSNLMQLIYDPNTDAWTNQFINNSMNWFINRPPWQSLKFSGYNIAIGERLDNHLNVFYKIEKGNDTWTSLPYTGPPRSSYVGFSIGQTGYIGLGLNSSWQVQKDFWKFDPEKF